MEPKAPLEKILGPSAKNGYPKIVQMGDPLGQQGAESLREGGKASNLPPLNPPLLYYLVGVYEVENLAQINIFSSFFLLFRTGDSSSNAGFQFYSGDSIQKLKEKNAAEEQFQQYLRSKMSTGTLDENPQNVQPTSNNAGTVFKKLDPSMS